MNMLLRAKKNRKRKQFFKKNRKGVSIMVGYVLLVVFAIILSLIAYQWIKTYVPSDPLQCPDSGVSVSIKALYYDCDNNNLYLNIKNNGRFNILGYFAHASNVSGQEIATIDLSEYFNETLSGGQRFGNSIAFISSEENLFKPGDEKAAIFNLTDVGDLTSIQITPTRIQEVDNKKRFISCGNEKIGQEIYCGMDTRIVDVICTPDCAGRVCGTDPVCGTLDCGTCPDGQSCDALGQCYSDACTPASDPSLSGVCGSNVCGTAINGTAPNDCGSVTCGLCDTGAGEICVSGQCTLSGNDICDAGETCADSDCDGKQADECEVGEICQSGSCAWQGGVYGEDEYCIDLGLGYSGGDCVDNNGQCINDGGINENDEPGASTYCPGQVLCCTPETRIVFISSSTHDGTIGAGGLNGADAVCAGDTAGIPGTFVAWLSTDTIDAKDRIADGAYYLYDGTTLVANDKADLLDGTIDHVIDRDASGNLISGTDVWTGTNSDGTKASSNCNNWQSNGGGDKGWTGDSGSTSTWTDKGGENSCDNQQRIYCFRVAN